MSPAPDHYEVLGVERTATPDDIKAAFRRLAYLHPDKHPNDPTARRRFARITEAHAVLSDGEARAKYDRTGPNASAAHVSELVDLVADVARDARELDGTRIGLRLLDKATSTEGRQELRGFWANLKRLVT